MTDRLIFGAFGRWVIVYGLLMASAIMGPYALRCRPRAFITSIEGVDALLNIGLFAPIGWMLCRRPAVWVGVGVVALSAGLEGIQTWTFRTPAYADIVANGLGGMLGYSLGRFGPRFDPIFIDDRRRAVALVSVGLIAAWVLYGVRATPRHAWTNWRLQPLVVGAEDLREARWPGGLRQAWLYDRPLAAAAFETAAVPAGAIYGLVLTSTPTVHLGESKEIRPVPAGFRMTSRGLVDAGSEGDSGAQWRLPEAHAARVLNMLPQPEGFTIALDVVLPPHRPRGFSQILSLSGGWMRRNFTVGHWDRMLTFMVRSTSIGLNGSGPKQAPVVAFEAPEDEAGWLVATVDPAWVRLSWQGRCVDDRYLPTYQRWFSAGRGVSFLLALAAVGGAIGLRGRSTRFRGVRSAIGAAGAIALVVSVGGLSGFPPLEAMMQVILPILTGLASGWALAVTPYQLKVED